MNANPKSRSEQKQRLFTAVYTVCPNFHPVTLFSDFGLTHPAVVLGDVQHFAETHVHLRGTDVLQPREHNVLRDLCRDSNTRAGGKLEALCQQIPERLYTRGEGGVWLDAHIASPWSPTSRPHRTTQCCWQVLLFSLYLLMLDSDFLRGDEAIAVSVLVS